MNDMDSIREQKMRTAAFSGHRIIAGDRREELKQGLAAAVADAYAAGIRRFLCGMAQGFDLMAADAVLALRETHPDVCLVAVVPFREQSARLYPSEKAHYDAVLSKADEVVVLSELYFKDCLLRRNDYLLAKSSRVIFYYDGAYRGGTCYTWNRAHRQGLTIVNLY